MLKKILMCCIFSLFLLPVTIFAAEMEEVEMDSLLNEGEFVEDVTITHPQTQGYNSNYDEALKNDLINHKAVISVSGYGFTTDNVQDEVTAFINRNPEIFFVDDSFKVAKDSSGRITKLSFTYLYSKDEVTSMLSEIESETDHLLDMVDWTSLSDSEKVLLVHDYIGRICTYNLSAKNAYNLYGAIVERNAVCQGYAQAEEYFLKKLGVTAGVATSMHMSHAWNVVYVNGNWYHSDPTFDDHDYPGNVSHRYVLLSTKGLYKADDETGRNDFTTTIEDFSDPTNTSFESMYWVNSDSAIAYVNGKWYYSPKNSQKIIERSGSSEKTLWQGNYSWENLSRNYVILSGLKSKVYFTGPDGIYSVDPSSKEVIREMTSDQEIYGLNLYHDTFEYANTYDETVHTWKKTHDHSYTLTEVKDATVTTDGYKLYSCSCGDRKKEILPATKNITGCTMVFDKDTLEFTGGETKPDVVLKDNGTVLPSSCYTLSFTHSDQLGTATVKATGVNGFTGSVSKNYQIVHTVHSYDAGVTTKEATCTTSGTKVYTCSICHQTKETRTLALGHNFEKVSEVAVDCTHEGSVTKKCTRCGKEKTTTVTALGHNPVLSGKKAATSSADGYSGDTICSRCKTVLQRGSVIPKTGHAYDKGTVVKKATCTKSGILEYHCTDKGCTHSYQTSVPAKGHSAVKTGAVAATCKKEGYTGDVKCSVCGQIIKKGSVVAKTAHAYESRTGTQTIPKSGYKILTTATWQECRNCYTVSDKNSFSSISVNKTTLKSVKYKKGKTVAKWKKVKGVSGYILQYSKTKKKPKTVKCKILSKTLKGKYYVRIRTYKKIKGKLYYSKWSKYMLR